MPAPQRTQSQAVDDWYESSKRNGAGRVSRSDSTNLADLLERILDKGVVIAGDISISLVDVELLTIKLRLLIASVDKAREMGINWWENDPWLSTRAQNGDDAHRLGGSEQSASPELEDRFNQLELAVDRLADAIESSQQGSATGTRRADQ